MSTEQNSMSAEEKVEVYSNLSSADLAKQINDDYSVILGSERANLPRALAIAPKLHALRIRTWRQWKTKFPSYDLQMSYETASVYLRIWENWTEIRALAVKKGVEPTLLTIDAARELWAKRKETNNDADADDNTDTEDNTDAEDGDGQKYNDLEEDDDLEEDYDSSRTTVDEEAAIEWLRALAPDELIGWLRTVQDDDWLSELTQRLATHLGMTLMPMANLKTLLDITSEPAASEAAPA